MVVIDEKYGLEKYWESGGVHRRRPEKAARRTSNLRARAPHEYATRDCGIRPSGTASPQSGMEQRESPTRNKTAIGTANPRHSTQEIGCGYGRIVVAYCVAPRDPRRAILTLSPFDQPVNKETVVAQN